MTLSLTTKNSLEQIAGLSLGYNPPCEETNMYEVAESNEIGVAYTNYEAIAQAICWMPEAIQLLMDLSEDIAEWHSECDSPCTKQMYHRMRDIDTLLQNMEC